MSEEARVEVRTGGEDTTFWLRTLVNGVEVSRSLHVPTIEQGESMTGELMRIIKDVYRVAYRDGARDAQATVREAIGLTT